MDNARPLISVVIVTWNVKEALKRCLVSLERYADTPVELFVVDNGSTDATPAFLHEFRPSNSLVTHFEVITNDRDLGFATAANIGLRRATGEYILLLNPDTQLVAPSFQKMAATARSRERLGMLGFQVTNPDGKIQQPIGELPRIGRQLARRLGWYRPKFDFRTAAEVEQINAAAALMPKEVVDEIGLWDEKFFLWFEENDYCKRLRDAGYKIYYTPEVRVLHERQAGIAKMPFWERQGIWTRSMFHYFRKHHGLLQAVAISVLDPLCMWLGIALKRIKKIV